MAHFSPYFSVRKASTKQDGVRWGEIKISHIISSSSCLVGMFWRSPGFEIDVGSLGIKIKVVDRYCVVQVR